VRICENWGLQSRMRMRMRFGIHQILILKNLGLSYRALELRMGMRFGIENDKVSHSFRLENWYENENEKVQFLRIGGFK